MKTCTKRIFAIALVFVVVLANAPVLMGAEMIPQSTQTAATFAQLQEHLGNASVTSITITGTLVGGAELVVNRAVTLTGEGTVSFNSNGGQFRINNGGHLILAGPAITRTVIANWSNGVMLATPNSSFTIRGGAVRGHHVGVNSNAADANVQIAIEGGIIESNREGGIRAGRHATITMTGGYISNNGSAALPSSSGGVLMNGGGTFNMNGGEISNNIGGEGHAGGVTVGSIAAFNYFGHFTMTAGRITDNRGPHGGAIRVAYANAHNVSIAGAAEFTNNISNTGAVIRDDLFQRFSQVRPGRVSTGAHAFSNNDIYVINAPAPGPTVTGVTVSPGAVAVVPGGNYTFSAAVAGTGHPPQDVTWSVESAASPLTHITTGGALTVCANETAATLTVRATSAFNTNISGTAAVSVTTLAQPALSISSATAILGGEATVQVRIDNNPGFANLFLRISLPDGVQAINFQNHHPMESGYFVEVYPMPKSGYFHTGWVGKSADSGFNGVLLTLTLAVDVNAQLGTHPIAAAFENIWNPDIPTNYDGTALDIAIVNGEIEVLEPVMVGDANGDGFLTSADATVIARYLAGHFAPGSVCHRLMDTNCDGTLTPADITRFARALAGHFRTLCPYGGCARC